MMSIAPASERICPSEFHQRIWPPRRPCRLEAAGLAIDISTCCWLPPPRRPGVPSTPACAVQLGMTKGPPAFDLQAVCSVLSTPFRCRPVHQDRRPKMRSSSGRKPWSRITDGTTAATASCGARAPVAVVLGASAERHYPPKPCRWAPQGMCHHHGPSEPACTNPLGCG